MTTDVDVDGGVLLAFCSFSPPFFQTGQWRALAAISLVGAREGGGGKDHPCRGAAEG